MTEGPLGNGGVGVIIEDDHSGLPYKVRANGDTHWYKTDQVRRAPGSSGSGGAFTVSGAGMSRFNGTYNVDGTKSGAPSYRKAGSDETVERNGGKWYFCVDYGSSCYYKQTSGGDKPPERGWERASQGEGSPPTLKYTVGGSGRVPEDVVIRISRAGFDKANGTYKYLEMHDGKPAFQKQGGSGRIYYRNRHQCWATNEDNNYSHWEYMARTSANLPPSGVWETVESSEPDRARKPRPLVEIEIGGAMEAGRVRNAQAAGCVRLAARRTAAKMAAAAVRQGET